MHSKSDFISVALCADTNILAGLQVTLLATLLYLKQGNTFDIHLFGTGLSSDHIDTLKKTLDSDGRAYKLESYPFDVAGLATSFPCSGVTRSGAWMTFGRLLISKFIDRPRFVYLNSDLIVNADIASFLAETDGAPLGAVSWQSRDNCIVSRFFQNEGLPTELPYFNVGVLAIDRDHWMATDATTRALEVAYRYGKRMPSADQTILNLLFGAEFSNASQW